MNGRLTWELTGFVRNTTNLLLQRVPAPSTGLRHGDLQRRQDPQPGLRDRPRLHADPDRPTCSGSRARTFTRYDQQGRRPGRPAGLLPRRVGLRQPGPDVHRGGQADHADRRLRLRRGRRPVGDAGPGRQRDAGLPRRLGQRSVSYRPAQLQQHRARLAAGRQRGQPDDATSGRRQRPRPTGGRRRGKRAPGRRAGVNRAVHRRRDVREAPRTVRHVRCPAAVTRGPSGWGCATCASG